MKERNSFRGGFTKTKDSKIFDNFIMYFFRLSGILFTRIGIDELEIIQQNTLSLLTDYFAFIDRQSNKSMEVNKLIYLSLTLIFSAHATISESTREMNGEIGNQELP